MIQKIDLGEFQGLIDILEKDQESILNSIIIKKIKDNWLKIIGPTFYNYTEPEKYNKGTLYISTVHSAYSQEVQFHSNSIMKESNKILNQESIKKIQTKVTHILKKKQKVLTNKPVTTNKNLGEWQSIIDKEQDEIAKNKLLELIQLLG